MAPPVKKVEKEKNQNVQVAVRLRPMNSAEKKEGFSIVSADPQNRTIEVKEKSTHGGGGTRSFPPFDKVYGPASGQLEIYKDIVKPQLEEILKGYNCTIFAYGQTGTGKTFTMEGEKSDGSSMTWETDPLSGIIPRTLHHLFDKLEADPEQEFSVRVSFVELYNEQLYDLLGGTQVEKLNLYEDPMNKGSVILSGNEEKMVRNKQEVYQILRQGAEKRQTAATLLNAHSSRSHSVFTITVHLRENTLDGQELLKTGKMNLVDLAGSENIGRSGAMDKRAREAGNINQSLLTLGRVITCLVDRQPHIPYRESKLTRLLQDSLGGKTITTLIATVSPCSTNYEETISTLDYATRAKNIKNHPEVNQKLTRKGLIKGYMEEIEKLRRDLLSAREKNGIYLAEEDYQEMETKIEQQKQCIGEVEGHLQAIQQEMMKRMEELSMMDAKYRRTLRKLEKTQDRLAERRTQLKETSYNLAIANRDLELRETLIESHRQRETEILIQADKVLSIANDATADVKGLHTKVERYTETERKNLTAVKQFHDRVEIVLEAAQTDLKGAGDMLISGVGAQRDGIETVRRIKTEEAAELTGLIDGFEGSLLGQAAELSEFSGKFLSENEEGAKRSGKLTQDFKEKLVTFVDSGLAEMRSEAAEMRSKLAESMATVARLQAALKEQEEKHREEMRARATRCAAQWKETREVSETHCAAQSRKIEHAEKDLRELAERDAEAEEWCRKLADLVAERSERRKKVEGVLSELRASESVWPTAIVIPAVERGVTEGESFKSSTELRLTNDLTGNTEECEKIKGLSESMAQTVGAWEKLEETKAKETNELATSHAECLTSHIGLLAESFRRQDSVTKKSLTELTEEVSERSEGLKLSVNKCSECLESEWKIAEEGLESLGSGVSEKLERVGDAVGKIGEETEKLATEEVNKLKKTGSTPSKKEFQYPKRLPGLLDEEIKISEFETLNSPVCLHDFSIADQTLDESILSPALDRTSSADRSRCSTVVMSEGRMLESLNDVENRSQEESLWGENKGRNASQQDSKKVFGERNM